MMDWVIVKGVMRGELGAGAGGAEVVVRRY